MKNIEINIGKACNNRCRFCMSSKYNISKVGETFGLVKFEKIKKEIIRYSEKGYKSIGFIGGEISIHPNLYEIISESKRGGFESINVVTNGMVFSDYKKAEELIKSGVTRVNISIHSHLSDIENYLTQVNGGFEKKLKAINNFNDLYNRSPSNCKLDFGKGKSSLLTEEGNPLKNLFQKKLETGLKSRLSINIVLNGLNYKNIVETCLYFYKARKINDIRINFLWSRFIETDEDKRNLSLKYSDILEVLKKLIYISLKYDIRITFDSIPPCIFYKLDRVNYIKIIKRFLGEDFDYVDEVSNINKNKIFNWKEQKVSELKRKVETCRECIYDNKCEGIRKEYLADYGEDEFEGIRDKIL